MSNTKECLDNLKQYHNFTGRPEPLYMTLPDNNTVHVTESYWKVSLDRNTRYSSIHRIHGYRYCSLFLLLFTVYTIIVDCYTVLLLSSYRPNIINNMDINCHD